MFDDYENLVNDFSESYVEDYKIVLAIEKIEGVKRTNICKELFGNDIIKEYYDNTTYSINTENIGLKLSGLESVCMENYNYDNYNKFYSYDDVNKKYESLFGKKW